MTTTTTSAHTAPTNTIHRQTKRFSRATAYPQKPLYQAVSGPLRRFARGGFARHHCIKDGIFIDHPYNTGKDFVYKYNSHDSLKNYMEQTGQVDSDGNKLSVNTDTSGRYHTDCLNMMYPRLKLTRNLLTDDGVIFISIDDAE